jgi:hypothetical protein
MTLVDQPSAAPTQKVVAGGAAGAAAVLVVFIAGQFGVDVPPEVAAALTVLLAAVAAWLKREKAAETGVAGGYRVPAHFGEHLESKET